MIKEFDRNQLMQLLKELSDELSSVGQTGQLFIVGGAAISLAYDDARATRDIDAIFAPAPEIRDCAKHIADRHGLQHDWLNDAAKGFMPGNDSQAKEIFTSDSLHVLVASPEYLFAMKLHSSRAGKDITDAALLFNRIGLKNAEEALDLAESFYGQTLVPKHQYVAEEIAEKASKLHTDKTVDRAEWQETAAKYGSREVDWEKIAPYAPIQDDSQQTRNHQYDVDYPQPENSRFGYEINRE